ncbi:MAG: DUF1838 domain-containing protein [Gammaproteobacteria bacterium AqS3]|nr:DUF1838 domain-containing protein [Gammaproteobacteria bacterium AqS3]
MNPTTRIQPLRLIALALGLSAPALWGAPIDLATPEGHVAAMRKVQCSLKDKQPMFYTWKGSAYSRVTGERDRLLFKVEGMNVRQCVTVRDRVRGNGYRMVSREIMLYLDPETGEVMRQWENPWTGETIEVMHVANDPVNSRAPIFGRDKDGNPVKTPFEIRGDKFFLDFVIPLYYPNPIGGDYQPYAGNFYHSTEMFNFSGQADALLDGDTDTMISIISWTRLAPWLPWMKMSGRDGLMYFNATGRMLGGYDELSETMRAEIESSYSIYKNPPPTNDKRPNETSWTYFKKKLDEQQGKGKKSKKRRGRKRSR